jgi:hypothetical protein
LGFGFRCATVMALCAAVVDRGAPIVQRSLRKLWHSYTCDTSDTLRNGAGGRAAGCYVKPVIVAGLLRLEPDRQQCEEPITHSRPNRP